MDDTDLIRRQVCRTHHDLVIWTTAKEGPYCRQWHYREQTPCDIAELWIEDYEAATVRRDGTGTVDAHGT